MLDNKLPKCNNKITKSDNNLFPSQYLPVALVIAIWNRYQISDIDAS